MITKFKIFESESRIIFKNNEGDIYEYKGIYFAMTNGAFYLYFNQIPSDKNNLEMSYYLDEIYLDESGIESSGQYFLGEELDEVEKEIDKYWMTKETEKFNL